jgi:hypothetical protein
LIKGKH